MSYLKILSIEKKTLKTLVLWDGSPDIIVSNTVEIMQLIMLVI